MRSPFSYFLIIFNFYNISLMGVFGDLVYINNTCREVKQGMLTTIEMTVLIDLCKFFSPCGSTKDQVLGYGFGSNSKTFLQRCYRCCIKYLNSVFGVINKLFCRYPCIHPLQRSYRYLDWTQVSSTVSHSPVFMLLFSLPQWEGPNSLNPNLPCNGSGPLGAYLLENQSLVSAPYLSIRT